MKHKKWAYVALVVVALIAGSSWLLVESKKVAPPVPPAVHVQVNDVEIQVLRGSYCWEENWQAVCVDHTGPYEMIAFENVQPVIVFPGADVLVRFEEQPTEIQVSQWQDQQSKLLTVHKTFTAPTTAGVYVYEVFARWAKGDASYVFTIEIKEEPESF